MPRAAIRGGFDEVNAGEVFGRCLRGRRHDDNVLELSHAERTRIFNLGYYTWVEQQGVRARRLRLAAAASASGGAWSRASRPGIA